MTLSDSFVWWMTQRLSADDWAWIEMVLGAYVFAAVGWQRFNYWLYKDDGTALKRWAQLGVVVKGSAAAFVFFDSFSADAKPKPFVIILLLGIAIEQTASFFAQRRIDCARSEGKITGKI